MQVNLKGHVHAGGSDKSENIADYWPTHKDMLLNAKCTAIVHNSVLPTDWGKHAKGILRV